MVFSVFATLGISVAADEVNLDNHWARKYAYTLGEKENILPKSDNYDATISPKDFTAGLSKIVGTEVSAPEGETISRWDMLKLAVDNKYSAELNQFDFQLWALANDEEAKDEKDNLIISKENAKYFNLAYRPQYQLLNYRKNRTIAAVAPATYGEAAYMLYMVKYPPNRDPNQQITMVTNSEPDTMNPFTSSNMSTTTMWRFLSAGSHSIDDTATIFPNFCTRTPTVDNGDIILYKENYTGKEVDKMKVIYRLRPGIFFPPLEGEEPSAKLHELTAHDLMFATRVDFCPKIQQITRQGTLKVDYMKVLDKYTVEIGYNEHYVYASFGVGHLYKDMYEKELYIDSSNFNSRDDFTKWNMGPYILEKWETGDSMVFTPNPYAAFAQPLVSKIIVRFMANNNTIRMNLQSGNVDIVPAVLSIMEAKEVEKKIPTHKFVYTPAESYSHITPNLFKDEAGKFDLLGDKRVRQAILHAIDREKIAKLVSDGIQTPAHCWMAKKSKYYNDAVVKKYPYDPKKAEELLDAAGFKLVDINGVMTRCKDGDPNKALKLSLRAASGVPALQIETENVRNDLARVGIIIDAQLIPPQTLLGGQTLSRHQFELIRFSWVSSAVRPNADMWLNEAIPSESNGWSGQNMSGWVFSEEHNQICKEITKIISEQKLQELLDKEIAIWTEELPIMPMLSRYDVDVYVRDIQMIKPTGSNTPLNWNANFWYREAKKAE